MMRCKKKSTDSTRENARTFAKSGARLGAVAGGRIGPVTTGLASGFGGAVGYLTGAAIDGVETSLEAKPPMTDGGRIDEGDETEPTAATTIPVTEEE